MRSCEYFRAASNAPCAMPVACAAIPMRPPSSVDSATLYPSPSLPMRFAAGTSQSEKTNSLQAVALMPNFFSSLPTRNPGVPFSIDQRGDAFFSFGRIGVHINDGGIGSAAIGDPCFRAVDDVAVAFAHCFGLQRRGI